MLPLAALGVMVGVVLIVNAHRYGALGTAGGLVLVACGLWAGIRAFGAADRPGPAR